jgi:excisionase family DNA binding protein
MRYYSTTEAAAILNVDPSRVRMLCKLGRIETIKVGNTYGIAEDVLERFAAQERRPGRPRKDTLAVANDVSADHILFHHAVLAPPAAK